MNKIDFIQMCTLRGALRLELKGMKRRGKSAYAIIKRNYGLRGNKQSVLTQLCEKIEQEREYVKS
ncbi:MAG: hypothetical protein DRI65_13575 [Chloroflexota bacterium]|nr:MAG: hypothetical protein DRI65_13575 [Chloroflexota bacterium]